MEIVIIIFIFLFVYFLIIMHNSNVSTNVYKKVEENKLREVKEKPEINVQKDFKLGKKSKKTNN